MTTPTWTIRLDADRSQFLAQVANAATDRKWTTDREQALAFCTRREAQRAIHFEARHAGRGERVVYVNDPKPAKSSTDTTCQICARAIEAGTGVIAHHGYRRPKRGSGWQTGSCMGARHLPYEVSCDLIPVAIEGCQNTAASVEARIARTLSDPPAEMVEAVSPFSNREPRRYPRPEGFDPKACGLDPKTADWRKGAPTDYNAPGWGDRYRAYEAYGSRFYGKLYQDGRELEF